MLGCALRGVPFPVRCYICPLGGNRVSCQNLSCPVLLSMACEQANGLWAIRSGRPCALRQVTARGRKHSIDSAPINNEHVQRSANHVHSRYSLLVVPTDLQNFASPNFGLLAHAVTFAFALADIKRNAILKPLPSAACPTYADRAGPDI
jgi:hypothetical protein